MTGTRVDYGIDAPTVVRNLAVAGIGSVVAGVALSLVEGGAAQIAFVGAGCLLAAAGAMVVSSKVLKLRERDRILNLIAWRGEEQVLDVGCGRGLLVIGAAKRLSTGKAVGIDIWQEQDQSGNRPEATRANAEAEGVSDRVEVLGADARNLPFGDESFDVVLSSLVIHNLHAAADRAAAVREIVRVLKPGGRVAICDILHTRSYARMLEEKGLENVHRPRPHLMFFGPVWTVTGTKPHVPGAGGYAQRVVEITSADRSRRGRRESG